MTSLRFVLRVVAICARVAVSARGLAAAPVVGRRSRRLLLRALTICACLAAVAALVVAPPAAPAQAAPASRAAVAAQVASAVRALPSVGSRLSVTNPGGDLVASIADDGEDPAFMNSFFTHYWPQHVGLPDGADLSDLIQATYNLTANYIPGQSPPPTFSGGSYSVSGSTITIDIPAADIQGQTAGWIVSMLSALAGVAAYAIAWGICMIFMTAPVPVWGTILCSFVGTFFWDMAGYVVAQKLNGDPLDNAFWKKTLTASLAAAAGFSVFVWAAPWLTKVLPGVAKAIGNKLLDWAKALR